LENDLRFCVFKLFIIVRTFVGIHYRGVLEFVVNPTLSLKIPEF